MPELLHLTLGDGIQLRLAKKSSTAGISISSRKPRLRSGFFRDSDADDRVVTLRRSHRTSREPVTGELLNRRLAAADTTFLDWHGAAIRAENLVRRSIRLEAKVWRTRKDRVAASRQMKVIRG